MRAVRTEIARAYALGDGICVDHISDRVMRVTSASGDVAMTSTTKTDRFKTRSRAASSPATDHCVTCSDARNDL